MRVNPDKAEGFTRLARLHHRRPCAHGAGMIAADDQRNMIFFRRGADAAGEAFQPLRQDTESLVFGCQLVVQTEMLEAERRAPARLHILCAQPCDELVIGEFQRPVFAAVITATPAAVVTDNIDGEFVVLLHKLCNWLLQRISACLRLLKKSKRIGNKGLMRRCANRAAIRHIIK